MKIGKEEANIISIGRWYVCKVGKLNNKTKRRISQHFSHHFQNEYRKYVYFLNIENFQIKNKNGRNSSCNLQQ